MSRRLREIRAPFVAAPPAGARVRTRLRVPAQNVMVLEAAGRHLGSLAGRDLAVACAVGTAGLGGSRAARKRALTAESSSRWAGAITRTSEDQVRLAGQNLRAEQASLRARRFGGSRPGSRSRRAGRPAGPAGMRPRPSGTPRTCGCGR